MSDIAERKRLIRAELDVLTDDDFDKLVIEANAERDEARRQREAGKDSLHPEAVSPASDEAERDLADHLAWVASGVRY